LAIHLKLEENGLRSKGLSEIGATPRRHQPLISNRDTERLEKAVTQRKQRMERISNRDKNAVFRNMIWSAGESDRRLPDAHAHRILIGNQIIRTGANPKKTKDATHL
jgi:hypothetical protein